MLCESPVKNRRTCIYIQIYTKHKVSNTKIISSKKAFARLHVLISACTQIYTSFSTLFFLWVSSLWETARYRLKNCLKGPLNPKQPINHPLGEYVRMLCEERERERERECVCVRERRCGEEQADSIVIHKNATWF